MKNQLFSALPLAVAMLVSYSAFAQCCDFSVSQQDDPGSATFGVALGDIDGDQDLDVVAVYAYNGIQVYRNDGTGKYTFQTSFAEGEDFFGVYLTDLDFDGDLDLIAAAFYNSQTTKVFKNNGAGVFTLFQSMQTNIGIRNLGVGDLDGDGDSDLVIPASSGSNGQVWKNNGVGFFVNYQTLPGAQGEDAGLGDLDGDGDLDAFVVRNSSGAGNTVWFNDGFGDFTDSGQSLGLNSSQAVALGDLDGDGDLDAIEANWGTQQVWINDGNGIFTEGEVIDNNNYAKSVKLADNDLDGDLDIFLAYYGDGTQMWSNDGNASFSLCYESQSMYSHNMDLGDMDGDGLTDIYVGYFSNTDGDFVLLNRTSVATISANGPLAFCEGGSVTLTANPGASFLWNTDAETQSITVSSPGNYWVIVTDSAGCAAASALMPVVVYELPEVTYDESNALVFDNTPAFQLTAGNPAGGTYSGPGVTGNTFHPAVAGPGDHVIEYAYTDANGCSGMDTSLIVVEMNTSAWSVEGKEDVRIFPNPAGQTLTIQAGTHLTGGAFTIADALGRQVMTGCLNGEMTKIQVEALPQGVYFFKLEGKGNLLFMKQ